MATASKRPQDICQAETDVPNDQLTSKIPTAISSSSQGECTVAVAEGQTSATASANSPRITILTRSYPPAYLRGGPARSLYALTETLSDEFNFSIITSAFDESTTQPMHSVEPDRWKRFGHATIWYESSQQMPIRTIVKLLRDSKPQLIYLNSLFDYHFSVLPFLVARALYRTVPIILAPRGELATGALGLKRRKKSFFIRVFRMLGLHHAVTWHASTNEEKADIENVFGSVIKTRVAINLRGGLLSNGKEQLPGPTHDHSQIGSLVFFSRIVPKKNLISAIAAMSFVRESARLSIAGPIEDSRYWRQCTRLIEAMPHPRQISYVGTVSADKSVNFLQSFDLFILPTFGENFGHVILESLAAGTPVIIGRNTPWHFVETSGAGWLCDPANPQAIGELIEKFLSLDHESRERMRAAARSAALEILSDQGSVMTNRSMFRALIRTDK